MLYSGFVFLSSLEFYAAQRGRRVAVKMTEIEGPNQMGEADRKRKTNRMICVNLTKELWGTIFFF